MAFQKILMEFKKKKNLANVSRNRSSSQNLSIYLQLGYSAVKALSGWCPLEAIKGIYIFNPEIQRSNEPPRVPVGDCRVLSKETEATRV